VQRYRCQHCGKAFQSHRQHDRKRRTLWNAYIWGRQSIAQLATTEGRSHIWIKQQLDMARPAPRVLVPRPTVIVADTTFWGRAYGVTVFRSPSLKQNLWWRETVEETPSVYAEGYASLRQQGWTISAAVIDGKPGIRRIFQDIPVQICQFHQMKTVTKYLTRRPETIAGAELRRLTLTLARTTEPVFTESLLSWYDRHRAFLDQQTFCPWCSRKHYTHRRLRSAYRSLVLNLPYLFIYQRYPELMIPNTTNCLDGMFSQIKNRLAVHRGLRRDRRFKLISEILSGRPKSDTKTFL